MARMPMRAFFLCVAVLALAAPGASAAIADRFVPDYHAASGVTAVHGARGTVIRFGPKAAKLYRGLAGKKAVVGCGQPVKDNGITESSGYADTGGRSESFTSRAGMTWIDVRLPRKRGRVTVSVGKADVCFIATDETRSRADDFCLPPSPGVELCTRVVVALNDQGLTDIDEHSRALELDLVFGVPLADIREEFGSDAVALDGPDASPPAGKVGVFRDGQTTVAAALLRDGRRYFIRQDADLFSTNVPALSATPRLRSLF
jgi:hypothetical protein